MTMDIAALQVYNQSIQDMEDQLHAPERLKGRASADTVGIRLHADVNSLVEPLQHWGCTDTGPPKQAEVPNGAIPRETMRGFKLSLEAA